MPVPLIDLSQQHQALDRELKDAFSKVLASGSFILGDFVDRFERDLAKYIGATHAIGVTSGTDALLLAMMAMDIGPGDEVIVPAFTFFATASCVARLGATPVFCDVSPRSFNMDPDVLEQRITPKTKAVIPVHLFGLAAKLGDILDIAKRHDLWVIEDCAQSLGAEYEKKQVGTFGDVGCFSFYPTKNLPALGDAGAITTEDAKLAEKMKILRVHGSDRGYHHPLIGGNFRLDALHAALLSVKLPHLAKWLTRRRQIAERLTRELEAVPATTPMEIPPRKHVYNNYTIRVRSGGRDAVQAHLAAKGIGTRVYYPIPLHLQPCFKHLGHKKGDFPVAEMLCDEVLSLPIYPEMTDAQADEVIAGVRDYFRAE